MHGKIIRYILNNHFLTTVLFVALAFFLYEIKSILVVLFVSYIIMASLYPFVRFLRNKGVPKIIALLITYGLVIAFIILLVFPILPFFIEQIQGLFKAIPGYIDRASAALGIEITKSQLNSAIVPAFSSVGRNIVHITSKVFGSLFSVLSIFILSFYLLLDRDRLEKTIPDLFPTQYRGKIKETMLLKINLEPG